jgi:hypothetical protein
MVSQRRMEYSFMYFRYILGNHTEEERKMEATESRILGTEYRRNQNGSK